ncbi:unnamed protein product [Caenorhabditis sp. 36 PRJEB53466]|nr:unnamed protein product [Caenorhabditis sp. 36 PRJEB53466]
MDANEANNQHADPVNRPPASVQPMEFPPRMGDFMPASVATTDRHQIHNQFHYPHAPPPPVQAHNWSNSAPMDRRPATAAPNGRPPQSPAPDSLMMQHQGHMHGAQFGGSFQPGPFGRFPQPFPSPVMAPGPAPVEMLNRAPASVQVPPNHQFHFAGPFNPGPFGQLGMDKRPASVAPNGHHQPNPYQQPLPSPAPAPPAMLDRPPATVHANHKFAHPPASPAPNFGGPGQFAPPGMDIRPASVAPNGHPPPSPAQAPQNLQRHGHMPGPYFGGPLYPGPLGPAGMDHRPASVAPHGHRHTSAQFGPGMTHFRGPMPPGPFGSQGMDQRPASVAPNSHRHPHPFQTSVQAPGPRGHQHGPPEFTRPDIDRKPFDELFAKPADPAPIPCAHEAQIEQLKKKVETLEREQELAQQKAHEAEKSRCDKLIEYEIRKMNRESDEMMAMRRRCEELEAENGNLMRMLVQKETVTSETQTEGSYPPHFVLLPSPSELEQQQHSVYVLPPIEEPAALERARGEPVPQEFVIEEPVEEEEEEEEEEMDMKMPPLVQFFNGLSPLMRPPIVQPVSGPIVLSPAPRLESSSGNDDPMREQFQMTLAMWERRKEEFKMRNFKDMTTYFFDPKGRKVVPQVVGRLTNSYTLFQQYYRYKERDDSLPNMWKNLSKMAKNGWSDEWKTARKIQSIQLAEKWIRLKEPDEPKSVQNGPTKPKVKYSYRKNRKT